MAELLHLFCHSEIQDGGCKWRLFPEKLSKTNNLDCMQDNCIIPTALRIFLIQKFNETIFYIAWCKRKSKSKKIEEEILITSQLYNIAAKFQPRNSCFQRYGIQQGYFPYYVMQAEVRNPKWRVTNRKYLYFGLYTSLLKNSKSNSHASEVNEFKQASPHTFRCKRKSEIQDGGFKRGNTNSSAYIQHSCQVSEAISIYFDVEKFR